MGIKQILDEKREIHRAIDKAIDQTFNEHDQQIREEGRNELEGLRGKDNAVPFL